MCLSRATMISVLASIFIVTISGSQAAAQNRTNRRIDRPAPIQVRPADVRQTPVAPSIDGSDRSGRTRTDSTPEPTPVIKDEIPEAALLTERGLDLASRLRILRISEARLGENHPSYQAVKAEIKDIKQELTAWTSVDDWERGSNASSLAEKISSMNENDLKQLVIQLVVRMGQLEDRVANLEKPANERSSLQDGGSLPDR